jgi:hypothetical protein
MRGISQRLDALDRAADKAIFDNAFPIAIAIAFYLGGATKQSEIFEAHARTLGYQDLDEYWQALIQALTDSLLPPSDRVGKSRSFQARARRAESKLLAKFGYDLRRISPAALADAPYRIVRTLPERWRAMIKRVYNESYEADVTLNRMINKIRTTSRKRRS